MMNGFLINVVNFLGTGGGTDVTIVTDPWMKDIVKPLQSIVLSLLWPILFVLSVVGIVYVVMLGVQYAKAESPDNREKAKSRMVNAIVGIVIMLVLIIAMLILAQNLENIITWIQGFAKEPTATVTGG